MYKSGIKSEWPLIGNSHIFEFLSKSLAKNNIAGSYIFAGPEDLGKSIAANFFARILVCQNKNQPDFPCGQCQPCVKAANGIHSDIYLIKKLEDKKNISIEQVRDFIKSLSMSSFLNSYKIGIIKGAESLSQGAVNALLKTLEEPKIKVAVILTVANLEALPKTILSRSRILNFLPVKSSDIYDDLARNHKVSRSQAKNFSRLSAGRPALALKFLEEKKYYENYERIAKSFAGFLSNDINRRFAAIEDILGKQARGQESAAIAAGTVQIWRNMARDLMLLKFDMPDLAQHEFFLDELSEIKNKFDIKFLMNLMNILKRSMEYLASNVNAKLALESAAASF